MNKKFKAGDKVRLIPKKRKDFKSGNDCFRCGIVDEMVGIVELHDTFTVAEIYSDNTMEFVEDKRKGYWDCSWFEKVEEEYKPIFDEIKLSYCEGATVATHNGKIGMAFRSRHDKEDRKIGILIATMRALGFKKKTVDKVIDILFDDVKEIKDYSTEELLKEIIDRVK